MKKYIAIDVTMFLYGGFTFSIIYADTTSRKIIMSVLAIIFFTIHIILLNRFNKKN